MKLIVCKGYRILCCKNNFVDCQERVGLRCYWSYGLGLVSFGFGLGLGLEPCGLVNITGPLRYLVIPVLVSRYGRIQRS